MARLNVNGRTFSPALVDPRVGITASPSGSDRYSTNDSFVFLLTSNETVQGSRDLQVSIYTLSGRPESNTANNSRTQPVTFTRALYLSMYGATYGNTNPTLGPAPWSDFEAHRLYTRTVFPVTDFYIRQLAGNPTPSFANDTAGGQSLEGARAWAGRMLASMPAGSRIYLLQPEEGGNGAANPWPLWLNGQNSFGSDAGPVMAQEAGHSFGLWWHAPGNYADIPNDAYPYGERNIGPQTGFDTRSLQPLPRGMGDIMSYFSPVWISPFTYCALLNVIPDAVTCPGGVERASAPGSSPLTVANPNPFFNSVLSNVSYLNSNYLLAARKPIPVCCRCSQPGWHSRLLPIRGGQFVRKQDQYSHWQWLPAVSSQRIRNRTGRL